MLRIISILTWLGLAAAAAANTATPSFVYAPLQPGVSTVLQVESSPEGDLVLLDSGYDSGLRPGITCQIQRDETLIAEVVLVASRADRAVALITDLAADTTLNTGDFAFIKTLQFND